MTVGTQGATGAKIAVPRAYQDYLTSRRDRRLVVTVAALVGLTCLWPSHADYVALFLAAVSVAFWYRERRKPWYYTLTEKEITVIWMQGKDWFWDWFTLVWARIPVAGYEHTEWRGLPALRLLRRNANPRWRPDWLIVYAHEDAEYVQTQVLPLIDRCRRHW